MKKYKKIVIVLCALILASLAACSGAADNTTMLDESETMHSNSESTPDESESLAEPTQQEETIRLSRLLEKEDLILYFVWDENIFSIDEFDKTAKVDISSRVFVFDDDCIYALLPTDVFNNYNDMNLGELLKIPDESIYAATIDSTYILDEYKLVGYTNEEGTLHQEVMLLIKDGNSGYPYYFENAFSKEINGENYIGFYITDDRGTQVCMAKYDANVSLIFDKEKDLIMNKELIDILGEDSQALDDNNQIDKPATEYEEFTFDFGAYVGNYIPAADYSYAGEVSDITLTADGVVTGNVKSYGETIEWAGKKPYMMEENSDGSITFRIEESADCSEFYILYPAGVKDRYDTFDSNKVRIEYVVAGGGIIGYTYYKEDTNIVNETSAEISEPESEQIVLDYNGVDWVSLDAMVYDVGEQFVSGTGITYTVISKENTDSGRTTLLLQTQDGQTRWIGNIPAFLLDFTTGISYYDIYEDSD